MQIRLCDGTECPPRAIAATARIIKPSRRLDLAVVAVTLRRLVRSLYPFEGVGEWTGIGKDSNKYDGYYMLKAYIEVLHDPTYKT